MSPGFFIKQIPWYAKNKKLIQNKIDFLYELQQNEIPLPNLLLTSKGKKMVTIADNFYYLTDLISNQGFTKNKAVTFSLGENIAKIHAFSLKYSSEKVLDHNTENILESCLKLSELLSEIDNQFVKSFIKNIELPNYEEIKFLVHGDINPSNVLFSKNSIVGFVDFDNVVLDNPVRDFAEALVTFCIVEYHGNTSNIKRINEDLDEIIATSIIEGYKKNTPHIFIKFKHLIVPAVRVVLLEIFLVSKLRGFFSKDTVYKEPENALKQLSDVLIKTEITQGVHIVDTFEENQFTDNLTNGKKILFELKNKVQEVGLHSLRSEYLDFEPGYTLYVILEESHITMHTWPNENKLHLDIFVCNYTSDNTQKAYEIYDFLKSIFNPKHSTRQIIFRK